MERRENFRTRSTHAYPCTIKMNNDLKLKKIKLNALIKKIAYEEHRKKWKETPDEDPIEKELALSRYIELKSEYYDLIQQIKEWD
jgi:hypothetical protein